MAWQDEYENVEDRLVKFWKDNPNGRIETEPTYTSEDAKVIVIRALVYKDINDVNPVSTGIAEETKGQGNAYVNNTSWVENCETSAIGRALANWMYQGSGKKRPSIQEMTKTQKFKDDNIKVEKVDMRKKENQPTEEEKAKMEKVADEMVSEPKTPTGKDKKNAEQMNHVMQEVCSDEKQRKEIQATVYSRLVDEDGFMEDVEKWSSDMMTQFLDEFEQMYQGTTGNINNVNEVFETEEIEEGGGDMSNYGGENPASEGQMKWVNDIMRKAQDKLDADSVKELKAIYGDGNLTGTQASEIITNWNDKVS